MNERRWFAALLILAGAAFVSAVMISISASDPLAALK
jgi:hypothetical protein